MTAKGKHSTREGWLLASIEELRPAFAGIGADIPKQVRISVGWPRSAKANVIGQCWASHSSADAVPSVFISPKLHDPVEVLATVVHELVHAVDDCDSGHRGAFAKIARTIGLEGKLTATHAGPELEAHLKKVARTLGKYPHAAITPGELAKKQGTRMLKCECPVCGYTVRSTAKWLDEFGAPWCPVPHPEHDELTNELDLVQLERSV